MSENIRTKCPVCEVKTCKQSDTDIICGKCGFDFAFVKYASGEKSKDLLESKIKDAIDSRTKYPPCRADKKVCRIDEERDKSHITVQIFLSGKINDKVTDFYYVVRTEKDYEYWATVDEVEKNIEKRLPNEGKITKDTYMNEAKISFVNYNLDTSVYYVSIFTIYKVGKKVIFSVPEKIILHRPLLIDISWALKYSKFAGLFFWLNTSLKLFLEVKGNIEFNEIPELELRVYEGTYKNDKLQSIKRIEKEEINKPKKEYKKTYEIVTDFSINYLKKHEDGIRLEEIIDKPNIDIHKKNTICEKKIWEELL